mmetsp:Transcript_26427/g.56305  ORF Transcript_26427/g.56305 Transcript_26427/m.56305 type:complete len:104 (+) Transcript_26427:4006-4317(+)
MSLTLCGPDLGTLQLQLAKVSMLLWLPRHATSSILQSLDFTTRSSSPYRTRALLHYRSWEKPIGNFVLSVQHLASIVWWLWVAWQLLRCQIVRWRHLGRFAVD